MPTHSPRAVDRVGREMKLSVPKPIHGWREFAGEVGIIVLGVLIALGAQQVAEGGNGGSVRAMRASGWRARRAQ